MIPRPRPTTGPMAVPQRHFSAALLPRVEEAKPSPDADMAFSRGVVTARPSPIRLGRPARGCPLTRAFALHRTYPSVLDGSRTTGSGTGTGNPLYSQLSVAGESPATSCRNRTHGRDIEGRLGSGKTTTARLAGGFEGASTRWGSGAPGLRVRSCWSCCWRP
jgi:hypothetical protein